MHCTAPPSTAEPSQGAVKTVQPSNPKAYLYRLNDF